jgi:hypothetical protein
MKKKKKEIIRFWVGFDLRKWLKNHQISLLAADYQPLLKKIVVKSGGCELKKIVVKSGGCELKKIVVEGKNLKKLATPTRVL